MTIYQFPFQKVQQGSHVYIWGVGIVGREYIEQIVTTKYCEIEGIVDTYSELKEYQGIPVIKPSECNYIDNRSYVIAVENKNIANELRQELLDKGIEKSKIIHEVITCEFDDICDANILRDFWARRRGIEPVQDTFLEKNFYISDVPFYFQKDRKSKMINAKNRFCLTDSVNNTLDLTRVFFLEENLPNVLSKVNGDVAEIGVYQGATAEILARYCNLFKRKLFLFDTFDGFKGQDLAGIDADRENGKFSDTSQEKVKQRVGDWNFISWKTGWFPDSIDEECRNTKYAFVHIDCDLYNPISEALSFFWKHLVSGGMIAVHDYSSGLWEGATRAVDEFCEREAIQMVLIPDLSGTVVLIKH